MRRWFILLFLLLVSSVGVPLAFAEGEVVVRSEIDKAFITIGEPIQYRLTVEYDPAVVTLLDPMDTKNLFAFRIKEDRDLPSTTENGKKTIGKILTFTAFRLGRYVIDPVSIRYQTADGTIQTAASNPLYVMVKTVDASRAPESDIRGLKPVRWLEEYGKRAAKYGVGLLVLVALLAGGWWIKKKMRAKKSPLTPSEQALAELDALYASALSREGRFKEWYAAVSHILRVYLEKEFQFSAPELTTREIKQEIRKKNWPENIRELLTVLLQECDMVKFADARPAAERISTFKTKTHELIHALDRFKHPSETAPVGAHAS